MNIDSYHKEQDTNTIIFPVQLVNSVLKRRTMQLKNTIDCCILGFDDIQIIRNQIYDFLLKAQVKFGTKSNSIQL